MEHLKKRLNQLLEKKIELDNYLAKQLPKSILQGNSRKACASNS
jgi:hypothetical protein